MKNTAKRRLGWILMLLGFVALYWMLAFTVLDNCGTNASLYSELQRDNGLPEAAGVAQEEMDEIDSQLARYLAGDATALDRAPFQAHELRHMEDVFDLFEALRLARNLLFVLALVFILGGLALRRGGVVGASLWGLALVAAPLLLFGVWAAIDFGGAFEAFHRALFRNELWMLDAQTDLLLKLCPEGFFSDFAAVIAMRAALYMLAVPLALTGIRVGRKFV